MPTYICLNGVSETRVPVSQHTLVSQCQTVVTTTPCPLTIFPSNVQYSRRGEYQREYQHTDVYGMTDAEVRPGSLVSAKMRSFVEVFWYLRVLW